MKITHWEPQNLKQGQNQIFHGSLKNLPDRGVHADSPIVLTQFSESFWRIWGTQAVGGYIPAPYLRYFPLRYSSSVLPTAIACQAMNQIDLSYCKPDTEFAIVYFLFYGTSWRLVIKTGMAVEETIQRLDSYRHNKDSTPPFPSCFFTSFPFNSSNPDSTYALAMDWANRISDLMTTWENSSQRLVVADSILLFSHKGEWRYAKQFKGIKPFILKHGYDSSLLHQRPYRSYRKLKRVDSRYSPVEG